MKILLDRCDRLTWLSETIKNARRQPIFSLAESEHCVFSWSLLHSSHMTILFHFVHVFVSATLPSPKNEHWTRAQKSSNDPKKSIYGNYVRFRCEQNLLGSDGIVCEVSSMQMMPKIISKRCLYHLSGSLINSPLPNSVYSFKFQVWKTLPE